MVSNAYGVGEPMVYDPEANDVEVEEVLVDMQEELRELGLE